MRCHGMFGRVLLFTEWDGVFYNVASHEFNNSTK